MQPIGPSYGQSLLDQVDCISAFFDAHIGLINDIRELYRDRAALERDYAAKLQVLTKKATERKLKTETLIVVGENPTKGWDDSTLRRSTLHAAYAEIINSMASTAQDHINVADTLTSQIVDVLKVVESKHEETKKKEMQFFQKLLSERDRVYAERIKSKQKYDEECSEHESHRQKQGRAHHDKHADRAAKHAEQQRSDMLSSKNTYLISTAIANSVKAKFYDDDLPDLEDQFQLLQTRLVERLTKILLHSQALQITHLDSLKSRLSAVETTLNNVNPSQDQRLFIEHNVRPFNAPADWTFEPCAIHYDTEKLSTEQAPKVFLQNKLARCRSKLQESGRAEDSIRKEYEQLSKIVTTYIPDQSLGNIDEVSDNYLDARHQLILLATAERILQAEINLIVAALGDDEGSQRPHTFKSTSFSIPAQCGYCQSSIWGLSKQGKTCKLCGLSVHSKCELKVPADCRHSAGSRHSAVISRNTTVSNAKSRGTTLAQTPSVSSLGRSTISEESYEVSYPAARMLFDFASTSEFELDVPEGTTVHVLEPDDGSGWVKVVHPNGKDGLVPAAYIAYDEDMPPGKPMTADSHSQQGSGQYVRGIYPYQSQGTDELDLDEGGLIELSAGPTGGQHYGDGWWEGIDSKGRKGIFPSNYVEMV